MVKPVTTVMGWREQVAEMARRHALGRINLGDSPPPFFRMPPPPENTEALQDFVLAQLVSDTRFAAMTEVYLAEQGLKAFGSSN